MPPARRLSPQSVWDTGAVLAAFQEAGIKELQAYRIWGHLLRNPGASWHDVPDVPKAALALLDKYFVKFTTRVVRCQRSSDGATTKLLVELQDGMQVEAVVMTYQAPTRDPQVLAQLAKQGGPEVDPHLPVDHAAADGEDGEEAVRGSEGGEAAAEGGDGGAAGSGGQQRQQGEQQTAAEGPGSLGAAQAAKTDCDSVEGHAASGEPQGEGCCGGGSCGAAGSGRAGGAGCHSGGEASAPCSSAASTSATSYAAASAAAAAAAAAAARIRKRSTLCVSSQVGCQMGCTFCATGTMGLKGNLTCGEIVEQLLHARAVTAIRNIVFMGMGEPLNNYEPVRSAVAMMTDSKLFGLRRRHVTVSTVGVIPRIKQLADDLPGVSLALSLHAPTQELRCQIVPSARAFKLPALMAAVRDYQSRSSQRVFYEYVVLAGVNDGIEQAHQLGQLLRGDNCVLNLIPWNPVYQPEGPFFNAPGDGAVVAFQAVLVNEYGLHTTVRREMGQDISGACGQLVIEAGGGGCSKEATRDIEDAVRKVGLGPVA